MSDNITSKSTLVFFVNGKKIEDSAVDPECTLLYYLRKKLRLCGTKLVCGEGGCGACTVMVSKYHRATACVQHKCMNACLTRVAGMHGLAVTTVEGIGSTKTTLHAVQERIAKAHGSQCGFCTPGMVMSMYTLLRNNPTPSMDQLDEYFAGNLCRCTGYRPILEGFRSLTTNAMSGAGCGKDGCCKLNTSSQCTTASLMDNGKNGDDNGDDGDNGDDNFNDNGDDNGDDDDDNIDGNGEDDGGDGEMRKMSRHLYCQDEFTPYNPSQELIFPPQLKVGPDLDADYLVFNGPRVTYHRPTTLQHLLHLKTLHPHAKIIVGNTEVGIEVRFKKQVYPVLINPCCISELTCMSVIKEGVLVGSAVTLTSLQEMLIKQVNSLPEHQTRVFSAMLEMLRWFAGKQIRNAAGIGGNIMTSSPISDLNPLLMAAGATLTLASQGGGERVVVMDQNFFTGYRKNMVKPDEVLINICIPFTQQDEYFFGYKQSRRRDDDIAIVNAGCRVSFMPTTATVSSLTLCFGGMAPTTVMAPITMKTLVGRVWDATLLEEGTSLLLQDLPLSPSAPGGMIEYRRALTLSMFFKFYLSVQGKLSQTVPNLVPQLTSDEEQVTKLHTNIHPSSTQLYEMVPESQSNIDPVGRAEVHKSAYKQATGEAVYIDDLPVFNNELFAGFVLSTRPHANIMSIDESKAIEMKGVVQFFCHRDIPDEQNHTKGLIGDDEEVLPSKKVVCVGQVIGVVIAEDRNTARAAAKLVEVNYQDLPPIITLQDAIRNESWYKTLTINNGDVDAALQTCDHIFTGEMHLGGQEHFYFETNSHLAIPTGEDGCIELFSSTQNPSETQAFVSKALGVDINKVCVRVKRMGGGFGGKETRTKVISVPICVAANKLRRPVRAVLERDEDMLVTGGRHPFLCKWKVGVSKDGVLEAVDMKMYNNGGYSLDLTVAVLERALFSCDNVYRCENLRVVGHACKTNLPSNTAFRGFGGPQGMMFMEDIITRVAEHLKMDPVLIREQNMYKRSGEVTHYRQPLERCTIRQCWDEVIKQADYHKRCHAVQQFNRENRYRKRGLAVIPVKFGISFAATFLNQSGALVLVYKDGSVLLSHGGTEMGQGLHTKMIQVASRALGIPSELIYISETSTDKVPNTSPTAASVSSDLNGMAVLNACQKIMERLKPVIDSNPEGTWEDWVAKTYLSGVSLSATGFYRTPGLTGFNFETGQGKPFNYFSFGAAVTEVQIDCLTGHHTVLQTDIVMDVGDSLNPAIDIGQVEGAFVQGQGLYTTEELLYSPEGVLLTRGPGAYKIPGFQDIPRNFNVSLLRGAPNPKAIFSSKAVGEPPLFLAASVFYGIKQAISSARIDQGLSQSFRLDSPATAERIRMSCIDFITQKIQPAEPGTFKPWAINV